MIMPIVSRKKMAMNESICATCCYRTVVSPTNYYWDVLHGGYVGQPLESKIDMFTLTWREGIQKAWAELPYDVDFSAQEGLQAKPSYSFEDSVWYVLYFTKDIPLTKIPLEQFISGPNAMATVRNEGCRHMDRTCLYIEEEPSSTMQGNMHVNATEAHVHGGVNYTANHVAMQYNS